MIFLECLNFINGFVEVLDKLIFEESTSTRFRGKLQVFLHFLLTQLVPEAPLPKMVHKIHILRLTVDTTCSLSLSFHRNGMWLADNLIALAGIVTSYIGIGFYCNLATTTTPTVKLGLEKRFPFLATPLILRMLGNVGTKLLPN